MAHKSDQVEYVYIHIHWFNINFYAKWFTGNICILSVHVADRNGPCDLDCSFFPLACDLSKTVVWLNIEENRHLCTLTPIHAIRDFEWGLRMYIGRLQVLTTPDRQVQDKSAQFHSPIHSHSQPGDDAYKSFWVFIDDLFGIWQSWPFGTIMNFPRRRDHKTGWWS